MSGSQIQFPGVTLTTTSADTVVQNTPQKVLLVGQKVAAGSAVSGSLVQNIASSGAPENALFGQSSMIAAMVRAFKSVNPTTQVDAIPLDDAAGTARTVTFTIGGSPTAAGDVTVVAGDEVNHKFVVAIATTDSVTDIADNITIAVNADLSTPYTCSNVAGLVTLTADNDGLVANDLGVEVITNATGVTLAIQVAEGVPGATDPTLTGVLAIATDRYQAIVWPYGVTTVLETVLGARLNPTNDLLDGVGFVTKVDTHANHLTDADENDQTLVVFADKTESETTGTIRGYIGPAQNTPTYIKSTLFAAIRALRLTDGANIASFVTSNESLDQAGGAATASLPYANTPITQLPTIAAGRGWTELEISGLIDVGRSVLGVNANGDTGLVGEVVTTYLTNAAAVPDVTFTFLNYVDTASQIREYRFNNLKAQYVQSRLTEGSVTRGRAMANEATITAFVEKLYQDLSGPGFVLVQGGDTAVAFYKANLTVALTLATGLVTITDKTPIVTQLRTIVMTSKIVFTVGA